jgi:hypothetical protein
MVDILEDVLVGTTVSSVPSGTGWMMIPLRRFGIVAA